MPIENKPPEGLQVERSTVTKLVITGAQNLDPITVFLEDLAPCKGKITVSCWGKCWTAYWGGRSIAQPGRYSNRQSQAGSFSRFMTLKMGRSASGVGR